MTPSTPERPAISTALLVFGWLTIAGACLVGVAEASTDTSIAIEFTAAGVLSGLLLLAVAAIVDKLNQIESHLRPEVAVANTSMLPAPVSASGEEMCRCGLMSAEKAHRVGHLCPKQA